MKQNPYHSPQPGDAGPTLSGQLDWFRITLRTYCMFLLALVLAFPAFSLFGGRALSLDDFARVSIAVRSVGALLFVAVLCALYTRSRDKLLLAAALLHILSGAARAFAVYRGLLWPVTAFGTFAWLFSAIALARMWLAPPFQLRLRIFAGLLVLQVLVRNVWPTPGLAMAMPMLQLALFVTAFLAFWPLGAAAFIQPARHNADGGSRT